MARKKKKRKVCVSPAVKEVTALHEGGSLAEHIPLTVDEYEAVRLMDHLGLTQNEAAEYMNVARTTVQAMYFSARRKIAALIVEGGTLRIEGGDYILCDGDCKLPECKACPQKEQN